MSLRPCLRHHARTASLATLLALGMACGDDSAEDPEDPEPGLLDRTSAALGAMASKALDAEGVPHVAQWAGNLFSVFFVDDDHSGATAVTDFAGAQQQALYRFRAFFHAMLAHGVSLPPSPFEAWFVNAAQGDAALDRVAAALPHAARAAAAARPDEGTR